MSSFFDLKITKQFLNAIEDLGFDAPSKIQEKAIPAIRSGQHVIGIAQTGTGKTAAYLLPVLQQLKYAQGIQARCLILVPTKELVIQLMEQTDQLSKYTDLRATALYGGIGRKAQTRAIHEGTDLIIATPRRLLELYEFENIKLNKIQTFILDEADRMMDMGFMSQINAILEIIPTKKQNLLFSATFSPKVEELSWNFMDFPIKIEITPEATPVETVEQCCYIVPNFQTKLNLLDHLLKDESLFSRVLIFTKTKVSANRVYQHLHAYLRDSIRLIHSNKGQNTRIHTYQLFKEGELRVMVATDVMARGIDIKDISHVINFDVPVVYEDYVHRIGRTGRAFRTGSAITFVTSADNYHRKKIEEKIKMYIPQEEIPASVHITESPFEEAQAMAREIDKQKMKENPEYKGAFHEKKNFKTKQKAKAQKRNSRSSNNGNTGFIKSTKKKKNTSKRNRNKNKK